MSVPNELRTNESQKMVKAFKTELQISRKYESRSNMYLSVVLGSELGYYDGY